MSCRALIIAALIACAAGCAPAENVIDGEGDSFGGPKADGFCADEGSIEARAILQVVNDPSISADELDRSAADGGAGLDRRVADGIVAGRPFATLAELDAVPFVGPSVCGALRDFACDTKGLCERPVTACDLANESDHATDVAALADPIAQKILQPGSMCPANYPEVIAKLRETDHAGCEGGGGAGLFSRFVTERGQVTGRNELGRIVTTRTCDNRADHGMVFLQSDLSGDSTALGGELEAMGFDETAGVFNYYTLAGGRWTFHGNSADFVTGGSSSRCARCHTGGGLVMRELDTPWMNWEGHEPIPGVNNLIARFPGELGQRSDGSDLEFIVKNGNRAWNVRRVKHLVERGTVADLLRPLFCTVEVNLDNGSDFHSPSSGELGAGDDLSDINIDFFVDPRLKNFGGVPMSAEVYHDAIVASNQRLVDAGGSQMRDKNGKPAIDTIFDFIYPERGQADATYVEQLVQQGVIDNDFAKDVLAVDLSRPIFSDARCSLLDMAPDLAPAERTADRIRDGFIARLQSSGASPGSAAGQLLGNLETPNQNHTREVDTFIAACTARPQAELMADVLKIASLKRQQARALAVLGAGETLPVDDLGVSPSAFLDPVTCQLR